MKNSVMPNSTIKTNTNLQKLGDFLSHCLNIILFSFLFLILINFENKMIEPDKKELKADCVIRETANATELFGFGENNRIKTINFVEEKCGVKPYHVMPTKEEIKNILNK